MRSDMPTRSLSPLLLRSPRPSLALGALVVALAIAAETLAIYPLGHLAPVNSLGAQTSASIRSGDFEPVGSHSPV